MSVGACVTPILAPGKHAPQADNVVGVVSLVELMVSDSCGQMR
jgi:hypothetical protein